MLHVQVTKAEQEAYMTVNLANEDPTMASEIVVDVPNRSFASVHSDAKIEARILAEGVEIKTPVGLVTIPWKELEVD